MTAKRAAKESAKTREMSADPSTVIGTEVEEDPNAIELAYVLMGSGDADFRVHAPSCRSLATDTRKSQYEKPLTMKHSNERDAVADLWYDQIRDDHDGPEDLTEEEWANYENATYFHTCVKFPRATRTPKAAKTAAAKRNAKQALAMLVVDHMENLALELDTEASPKHVNVLTGMTREEAYKTLAHWIHHLPIDQAEYKARRNHLPVPDRSDWK